MKAAGAFYLDGRRVVLIDTPGFDDTTRSDTDVLKLVAAFLETSYVKFIFFSEEILKEYAVCAGTKEVARSPVSSIYIGSRISG